MEREKGRLRRVRRVGERTRSRRAKTRRRTRRRLSLKPSWWCEGRRGDAPRLLLVGAGGKERTPRCDCGLWRGLRAGGTTRQQGGSRERGVKPAVSTRIREKCKSSMRQWTSTMGGGQ